MKEFDIIARYFTQSHRAPHTQHPQLLLGVGDDCALLQPSTSEQGAHQESSWPLAISTDTLVCGCHFFDDVPPQNLGHKALAVNLSDLAACGAQPLGFTLALTLPYVNDAWLAAFSKDLLALADAHDCPLIGGDTTRGSLSITVTILGRVPHKQAPLRSGAQAGDDIYVSHTAGTGLGDARLALHLLQIQKGMQVQDVAFAQATQLTKGIHPLQQRLQPHMPALRQRLERPEPRLALGTALRGVANACCDLSDGLQGDIRHILKASKKGAVLHAADLLAASSPVLRDLNEKIAIQYALLGGDDYELLFTAPVQHRAHIQHIAQQTGLVLTRVGHITQEAGLHLVDADGKQHGIANHGFRHF